jgi:signal transduction histidine kinase
MKSLYRQVYLYTLGVLIISMALATFSTGLLFNRREQGLFRQIIRGQVFFIKQEVHKLQRRSPELIPERLQELSQQLSWDMAYWYDGKLIYSSLPDPPEFSQLTKQKLVSTEALLMSSWTKRRPQMATQVGRSDRAFLWLEPRWAAVGKGLVKGPLLGGLILLLFLGLLLIPFTRFLLRPYQELQSSIERLSHGNFLEDIPPEKYPAFKTLIASFNHMQRQLSAMLKQKERLVADVSHELRSPLTRLRLALEILTPQLQHNGDSRALMHQAIGEIEELDHIIQDVLEVSRLQFKGLKLNPEKVNLTLFLFETLEDYELSLEAQHLTLSVDVPSESLWIEADVRLLKRLFNNLLSNTVKYAGGPGTLQLSLKEQGDTVVVKLIDDGPGIAETHLKNIFTPFYRIEDSRARDKGGVGLGLAIAYEIVQAHHGKIVMENAPSPQTGLSITVCLPRVHQRAQEQIDRENDSS